MAVLIRTFILWPIGLSNKGTDIRGAGHSCWMVAAPFCEVDYSSKKRSLTRKTTRTGNLELLAPRAKILCRIMPHHSLAVRSPTFKISLSSRR